MTTGELNNIAGLDSLEMMSLIVAGACHDYEHPGFSNNYLIDNKDVLAIKYNGKIEFWGLCGKFRLICIGESSYSSIIPSHARQPI